MAPPRLAARYWQKRLSKGILEGSYDPDAVTSWDTGDLSGKLRECQRAMRTAVRSAFQDARSISYILNCSRRLGKTFFLCTDAIEFGLAKQGALIRFGAPTQKMMRNILLPIIRIITMDAPERYRPIWKSADQKYAFPSTAGEMTVAGCNNGHEENLRGQEAHRAYLDEAGRIRNLKYVVNDIIIPQLLTTNGNLLIASTPPPTPVHDFAAMANAARLRGNYMEMDITKAGYDQVTVDKFIEEAGGRDSTTAKREYFCQFVVDESFAICPEWKPEFEREPLVDDFRQFYHNYDAMDIGVRDLTAVLFAWYDFRRAKLCVNDEFLINGPKMTTDLLAKGIKAKELDNFGKWGLKSRIADNNNLILLNDLGSAHKLHFAPTNKDTLEAMINELRVWVAAGRLEIHPRCKNLIGCLRYGVWKEDKNGHRGKDLDRYDEYGHFDALMALVYLIRNVDVVTNPVPPDFGVSKHDTFFKPTGDTKEIKMIKELFGPKAVL
jgi:hypothetical protein